MCFGSEDLKYDTLEKIPDLIFPLEGTFKSSFETLKTYILQTPSEKPKCFEYVNNVLLALSSTQILGEQILYLKDKSNNRNSVSPVVNSTIESTLNHAIEDSSQICLEKIGEYPKVSIIGSISQTAVCLTPI